jgi:hypothetical protein
MVVAVGVGAEVAAGVGGSDEAAVSLPSNASWSAASRPVSAGCGIEARSSDWNMSRTTMVADMMTSITSSDRVSSWLRSLSNRFSVRWHSFTSSSTLRKPAPPLMVWKPRKMSFSSFESSGRFSSSTSLLSTSESSSLASVRKSRSSSSMPAKSLIDVVLGRCGADQKPRLSSKSSTCSWSVSTP